MGNRGDIKLTKQYKPSETLNGKIQEFVDKAKSVDFMAQFQFEQTNRDVIITCISPNFQQITRYAVWEESVDGVLTGEVGGAILDKQRIF